MKEDIYRLFGLSIYREEMNESMRQLQQKEKISTLHGDTAKPPLKKKNQSLLNSTKIHDNRLRMTGSGQKIKEPLFNFVNSPSVSSCCSKTSPLKTNYSPSFPPTSSHGVATSVHDMFERIVYEAIAENATSLSCSNDPTDDNSMSSNSFSQEEKMAKIWSALLRHSEAGRFHQMAQEVSHGTSIKYTPPNPICTSLCLQIVQNALRLAGMPPFLLNMLIGGLSNSIYAKYDPSRSFQEHTQYATLAENFRTQRLSQLELEHEPYEDKIHLATSLIESMKEETQSIGVKEIISPFLSEDLLLVLWNATATSTASNIIMQESSSPINSTTKTSQRARASVFAGMVLQERVRLMLKFWQTLTQEERSLVFSALPADQSKTQNNLPLEYMLHSFEQTSAAEQDKERERKSSGNVSLLQEEEEDDPSKSLVPTAPPPKNSSQMSSGVLSPRQKTSKSLLQRVASRSRDGLTNALTTKEVVNGKKCPLLLSSLEDLSHNGSSRVSSFRGIAIIPNASTGTTAAFVPNDGSMSMDEVDALLKSHESFEQEVLIECEEVFDLLCDESIIHTCSAESTTNSHPTGGNSLNPLDSHYLTVATSSMAKTIQKAKLKLKDLLCNYLEDTEMIQKKFEKSAIRLHKRVNGSDEADKNEKDMKIATLVQAVIAQCHSCPQLLVHCFNQSPEILLRAISQNYGILHFAIATNPSVVKKFLSLDQKASDNLDLIIMRNKGIHLLWGTNEDQKHHLFIKEIKPLLVSGTSATGPSSTNSMTRSTTTVAFSNTILEQWFVSHLTELSLVFIEKPELIQQLFVQMERTTQDDPVKLYKMMRQLHTTKAVETFVKRMSMETMEHLIVQDVETMTRVIRDIIMKGKEDGLFEKLKETPSLALCLAEYDPKNVKALFMAHPETWRSYFVNAAAQDDIVLREALALRTKGMEGSDFLVDFYTSVLNRTTATVLAQLRKNSHGLNTFVDCSQTTSKRRCLYVQQRTIFGALGSVIINSTDFHPGHLMAQMKPTALIHALSHYQGKKDKSSRCISHSSNTTALSVPVRQVLVSILSEDCNKDGLTPPSSGSFTSIPPMWQPLISRFYRRHPERDIPKLTKPRLRILLLDILLEFIKIDEIVNENECLWGLAPFVCDYFMSRYVDRDVVGACLTSLIESLHTYQSDPRAKFFASACGLMTPHISYDMFLYYLQALEHILYGQMKIYEPENRLEERRDGACPVPRSVALAATSILFSSSLSKTELKILRERIEKAPALKEAPANQEIEIEIDQILVIYLEEWETLEAKLDEQYRLSFQLNSNGHEMIELEQFTRIIRTVTNGDVTVRECRMIFFDVGLDYLDIETFLQITHAYHLRSLHVVPPVLLPPQDLQLLQNSLGRFYIHSTEREIEDLHIYWRTIYHNIQVQIEASHQKKSMKNLLHQHKQTIERLLKDISTTGTTMSRSTMTTALAKVWDEIRACVKILNDARLLQRHLSGVYLQCCLLKWIQKARKQKDQQAVITTFST